MDIIDDYKQLRMIEALKEYNNMKVCYKENLKLCKWQEQQISRLATAIEKIAKLVEGTYEALDSRALQEIRQIIKEQTNERHRKDV
jgi:hypothetical protein